MDSVDFTIREEEGGRLVLEGECAVKDCEFLRDALVEALARSAQVDLDISALTRADVTFFQIAYAASLSARESGKRFRCVGPMTDAVRRTAVTAGFLGNNDMKTVFESEV